MPKWCDECEYSFSTATVATTRRASYSLCANCASEYDAAQKSKRLRTAIARLKREIAKLQALPTPSPAEYADQRFYKMAVTRRLHAVRQREKQIIEFEEQLVA